MKLRNLFQLQNHSHGALVTVVEYVDGIGMPLAWADDGLASVNAPDRRLTKRTRGAWKALKVSRDGTRVAARW